MHRRGARNGRPAPAARPPRAAPTPSRSPRRASSTGAATVARAGNPSPARTNGKVRATG